MDEGFSTQAASTITIKFVAPLSLWSDRHDWADGGAHQIPNRCPSGASSASAFSAAYVQSDRVPLWQPLSHHRDSIWYIAFDPPTFEWVNLGMTHGAFDRKGAEHDFYKARKAWSNPDDATCIEQGLLTNTRCAYLLVPQDGVALHHLQQICMEA